MSDIWDFEADSKEEGDKKRTVLHDKERSYRDKNGFMHYIFNKKTFKNPWYIIPEDDYELFTKFIMGGSRSYPSDGNIPCDIVAREARRVLDYIVQCSKHTDNKFCSIARKALENGKKALLRGTMKLYLGKYTTRDWRRKRFTDDIDFWTFQINMLEAGLKECGFTKDKNTKEWEKFLKWTNPLTNETRSEVLYAANNLNQLLDFGDGSYLEGASLRDIFNKKIKRGHDVDLSDIINVAMLNNSTSGGRTKEWEDAWTSFEQAANSRSTRIVSNLISLSQHSFAIADHLKNTALAINKHNNLIFSEEDFPANKIREICKISIHWQSYFESNGEEKTREMIHEFLLEEA
ncbi:MAG: hypothetical protein GF353_01330, partial [Candidatus Lokiarchaeota archaeon]|nr:hypothetical protein [Candidatus Lokiarchaeota archaeon]